VVLAVEVEVTILEAHMLAVPEHQVKDTLGVKELLRGRMLVVAEVHLQLAGTLL
jgi:hypothetical protein